MERGALKNRIKRIFATARHVDVVLLANTNSEDPNFVYVTDLIGGLFEGNFLLVTRKGVTLFTSPLEYELAIGQLKNGIKVVKLDSKKKIETLAKALKGKRVGINGNFVPYNSYKRIKKRLRIRKALDVSDAFEKARSVKSDDEIRRIRKASRITKKAIAETQKRLKTGVTEKEVAREFGDAILRLGADGTSFDPIISFGKNAALPHHSPDKTRLRYGDFVLMDVGVKVRNYCSDVTRTMIFGTDRSRINEYERKKRVIGIVRNAQKAAIASIREGVIGSRPHIIARDYIESADKGRYKGTFTHALGHSLGIEVHDSSGRFLSPGSKLILKAGMVSSVEPGIYIPGFGGARFEDDILVTRKGAVIL